MSDHKTNLNHDCDKHGCYRAELWDWTPFNECFGNTGIRISDVDGIVERNSQLLMLDGKRVNRKGKREISDGQRFLYKAFANRGGHVVVFHGVPPRRVQYVRQWRPGGTFVPEEPCDLDGLKRLVSDWFQWAEGMRAPSRSALIEAELRMADPRPRDPDDWHDAVTRYPPDHPKYRPVA